MTPTAVILAGGLGTRLRSITLDRWPKPMAPFAFAGRDHPFLAYPLAHLRRCGVSDVVLCIGHRGGQISEYFGDGLRFGMNIVYDDGGAVQTATRVRRALRLVRADTCLVLCGDVYSPLDVGRFMATLDVHADWLMQVAVQVAVQAGSDPGPNIAWGADERVCAYASGGVSGPRVGRESGVLAVRRAAFSGLDAAADLSLTDHVYPLLMERRALGVFVSDAGFFDIGSPAGHERFRAFVEAGGARPLQAGG